MERNPYAVVPQPALTPPGYPPPPPPPLPVPRHTPAGYAENQPGQPRTAVSQVASYEPAAPPSSGSVQVLGYGTAALLGGQVLLMTCLAAVSTWSVITYAGVPEVGAQPLPVDTARTLVTGLLYLSLPLCGIAFATWLCIATRNARSWGSPVRRGPGWAFGAWFVPFLSLWRPKQMVDDVWRASHPAAPPGAPLHLVARPGLTLAWWATWLIAPVVAQVGAFRAVWPYLEQVIAAARSGTQVLPTPDLAAVQETIAMWSLWAYVLWGISAFTAAAVVVQVTQWQQRRLSPDPTPPAAAAPAAPTPTAP